MEGIHFNFENFIFHHNINIKENNIKDILSHKKTFEIIEMLPSKIILPKYSSIQISLYRNNNLIKNYQAENLEESFIIKINEKKKKTLFKFHFHMNQKHQHK